MNTIIGKKSNRTPITWARHYIQNKKLEEFENIFELILKNNFKDLQTFEIAENLLTAAKEYNSPIFVPIILNGFNKISPIKDINGELLDEVSFITKIFGSNLFSDELLVFVINSLNFIIAQQPQFAESENIMEYDYEQVITELLNIGDVVWSFEALNRAERLFGEQSHTFYEEWYNYIKSLGEDYETSRVGRFISVRFGETNGYAEIPKWVKNFTDSPDIPNEDEFDMHVIEEEYNESIKYEIEQLYNASSIEELVKLATNGFSSMGIDDESLKIIKESLETQLKTKADEIGVEGEKWYDFVDEVLGDAINQEFHRHMIDDLELFRLYGPVNPVANQHLDSDTPSDRFGGCRMFLCDIFDADEDDEETTLDWFTGICEGCNLNIRVRWHAVRLPKLTGGWIGCYCSWDCVRNNLNQKEKTSIPLIDLFEKQLNEKGIQDRTVSNKI